MVIVSNETATEEEGGLTQKLDLKAKVSPVDRGKLRRRASGAMLFRMWVLKAPWLEMRILRHRDERRNSGPTAVMLANHAKAMEPHSSLLSDVSEHRGFKFIL